MAPSLTPLHPDESLIPLKLQALGTLSTEEIVSSLMPERPEALKTRPDGTILDGHHRLKILRDRGYDIHCLPRVIVPKHDMDS